jgi:hypothetical protein
MNRGPLIFAIVLLLLPVLYVGSYLALVTPGVNGSRYVTQDGFYAYAPYRYQARVCPRVYWALEMIDRKVRPGAWQKVGLEKHGGGLRVLDYQQQTPAP